MELTQGVLIAQVSDGSPAAKAGLHQGDVIVAYRGEPVTDVGDFRNRVALTPPGSREQLTIIRDGKRQDVSVTIGRLTEDKLLSRGPTESTVELGLTVQTLTPELAEQFDAKAGEGVVVTAVTPGSIAAQAGVEPGTIILQVNRKAVTSAAEFKQAVDASSGDKRVLLLVRKGQMQRYVALSW